MVWGGVDGTPGEQSDQEYAYRIAHVIRRVAWDEAPSKPYLCANVGSSPSGLFVVRDRN